MNLAFINRMLGITRGGGEIWDLRMAEGLEEWGADVTFYVGKPLRSELPEPIEEFETVEVPTPHLRDLAYAAPPGVGGALAHLDARVFCRRAAKAIQQRDFDLVQICSRPHFAQYVDQIDAPVSIVMHGEPYSLWYDVLKPGGSTYELLEKFDQIITVEGVRETIEQKVSCSIETVNPGVDTDHFIPSDTETINKRVLFVGRFVPAKNLSLLIEAFDAVIDNHPEAELVLVGDGPKRNQLEYEVQQRELTDQVQFPGYVLNKELPKWYQSANVFALSSRHESYGITLLEAMSSGIPIVAPRIGSIPAIVEDGRTGLLYTAGSVTELYTALDNFLSNPKSQTVCGQNAREKASNEFDWSERRSELFELYDSLINSQETTT